MGQSRTWSPPGAASQPYRLDIGHEALFQLIRIAAQHVAGRGFLFQGGRPAAQRKGIVINVVYHEGAAQHVASNGLFRLQGTACMHSYPYKFARLQPQSLLNSMLPMVAFVLQLQGPLAQRQPMKSY
eukprot:1158311-Pelagomonas_calceolata.AAC.10